MLAAAFTLAFATSSSACVYNQANGSSDLVGSDSAPGSLDAAIDRSDISSSSIRESFDFDSLKIAEVGIFSAVSLVAGGLLLKAYRSRRDGSTVQDNHQDSQATEQAEAIFEPAAFTIVIPPEALSSLHEDREKPDREKPVESELTRA